MSLLRRARRVEPEQRGRFWSLPGGGYGISTSQAWADSAEAKALCNAASWACINVIADAIGRTPFDVVRGDGVWRSPVSPIPPVIARPSGVVQPDVWRFQLGWSLATDGNAFGKITSYTGLARPQTIELLDPCAVTERKVVDGVAQVRYDHHVHKLYPWGDFWHVPGRSVAAGSPFGLSPIAQASRVIGTSLAAEEYSFRFFTDGGHPSAVIYSDKTIDTIEAQAIKTAWRNAVTPGSREPAVLGADLKHEKIQVDPGETQFIDLIRVMVDQVCRFWGVPPAMVFGATSGQAVTYANVTDNDLAFLKHSLDGYYVRVESAMTDLLPKPQIVKANRNAILRADPKARFEANAIALANRQVTVNELRALEDLPGFGPEFDAPGIPPFQPAPPPPDPEGDAA